MGNNISFKDYKGSISSHKAELLVCGLFEGEKILPGQKIPLNSELDLILGNGKR